MQDNLSAVLQNGIDVVKQKFLDRLRDTTRRAQELLTQVEAGKLTYADREELKTIAHKLAGTGKIFGFPELSNTGKKLDDLLVANPLIQAKMLVAPLQSFIHDCREALTKS